jgi:hypothetical protein
MNSEFALGGMQILYGAGAKGDGAHTFFELHRSGAHRYFLPCNCIEAGHKDFFCLARCGIQGVAPMKEIK